MIASQFCKIRLKGQAPDLERRIKPCISPIRSEWAVEIPTFDQPFIEDFSIFHVPISSYDAADHARTAERSL